jgi:hypothetical protein
MELFVLWSLTVWPAKDLNSFISAATILRLCEADVNQSCAYSGDSELCRVSSGWITSPSPSEFGGS